MLLLASGPEVAWSCQLVWEGLRVLLCRSWHPTVSLNARSQTIPASQQGPVGTHTAPSASDPFRGTEGQVHPCGGGSGRLGDEPASRSPTSSVLRVPILWLDACWRLQQGVAPPRGRSGGDLGIRRTGRCVYPKRELWFATSTVGSDSAAMSVRPGARCSGSTFPQAYNAASLEAFPWSLGVRYSVCFGDGLTAVPAELTDCSVMCLEGPTQQRTGRRWGVCVHCPPMRLRLGLS